MNYAGVPPAQIIDFTLNQRGIVPAEGVVFLDVGDAARLLVLVILIVLSAFFSSAETAMTACNKIRIRSMADAGDRRARKLLKVLDNGPKMLSTILIGNNIVNLTASSIATVFATDVFGSGAVGLSTGVLTLVVLIFGEISPKDAASVHADGMALRFCGIISVLMKIFTPVIFIVNSIAKGVLLLLGVDPDKKKDSITEDELRTIVDVSHEEGVIKKDERTMINNVVDFGDSKARDVMVPRIDMVMIDADATYSQLMDVFRENMFTRMPVTEGSEANVIGILNMKDILLYHEGDPFSIRNYLRTPFFTYEDKATAELLPEMRAANASLAIVLDEYGNTAGLVTLEDLLEEIVGDIRDEYDADEPADFEKVSDREYLVLGSVNLDDVNDRLGLSLQSEDYDTIGGYVVGLLDHLPSPGEKAEENGVVFKVERMDKKRVDQVRIILPEKQEEPEKEVDGEE